MKIQMESAHMVMPTNRLWNHKPNSGPRSISMSRVSRSAVTLEMSMLAFPATTPDALFTTLWATSKTPMTMLQVFVTIRTAPGGLEYPLEKHPGVHIMQVIFIGDELDQLQRHHKGQDQTGNRQDGRFGQAARIMLNTPPFQPWGVWPTWVAISPTFWFTLSNIPERLLVMPPTRISFSHCVSCSLI